MIPLLGLPLFLAALPLPAPAPVLAQSPGLAASPGVEEVIRGRIESLRTRGSATAAGDELLAVTALARFYELRAFEPAWVGPDVDPGRLDALLSAIHRSSEHGLDPSAYHLRVLDSLGVPPIPRPGTEPEPSANEIADLELLASDAFLVLGSHLLHGRVNPETIDPEWLANRRNARLEAVLEEAVGTGRIEDALFDLAPGQARYRRMLTALARLRATTAAGGWPMVPAGPTLGLGDEGTRVAALRARLEASGDLPGGSDPGASAPSHLFDEALDSAVRRFQERHGLEADGRVGTSTLAALSVPAADRARQVAINLERWRWLPAELGARHVEVNIPAFEARLVERGVPVSVHRAVVGRPFRATPMFSDSIRYLVLSPYWHVPPNIAVQDKLPLIRQDPGVLEADRMQLLDLATNRPVDPYGVDWGSLSAAEFNQRYRLRQDPGPHNALGAVKFMFPNPHNVYLHDTPTRSLFERTVRDFSSGCIRVERALDLAELLLADDPEWTRERIDRAVAQGVERTVPLSGPLPVHLLYWTAWADAEGTMHFRRDIYDRDEVVWRALTAPPPVE